MSCSVHICLDQIFLAASDVGPHYFSFLYVQILIFISPRKHDAGTHNVYFNEQVFMSHEKKFRTCNKKLFLLLAHLELCSRSVYAPACCPSSVRHQSLAFHIFDISSRTISWIEMKLSGRHCDNMEIQNC